MTDEYKMLERIRVLEENQARLIKIIKLEIEKSNSHQKIFESMFSDGAPFIGMIKSHQEFIESLGEWLQEQL